MSQTKIEIELVKIKRLVLVVLLGFVLICAGVISMVALTYSLQDELSSSMCVDESTYRDVVDDLLDDSKIIEAIDLSKEYIDRNPKDSQGYYYLGVALYLNGDWSGSIEQFDKAAEIEPEWAVRWINPYRDSAQLKLGANR